MELSIFAALILLTLTLCRIKVESTDLSADNKNTTLDVPDEEENLIEQDWSTFQSKFNKTYPNSEEAERRRTIFKENHKRVKSHNRDYDAGKKSFFLSLNSIADLSLNEIISSYDEITLPTSVDWRQKGAVTAVKYQGSCAGSHAFSAAGAIESHHFIKTGHLVELSTQNLIDCVDRDSLGCEGGYIEDCFEYVKNNPGIDTEETYQFEEKNGECRFNKSGIGANITGYVALPENDEKALAHAVATKGPVSVGIDAGRDTFQFYASGVYFDPKCKNTSDEVNHAVLVVGYGEEETGKYWIVKNSYGPKWGLNGYIKMAKDVNNHCGIASYAVYPIV